MSFHLRPATQADFPQIRDLIHQVHINPMGLKWPNFVVAVDDQDALVGCGQIKQHRDGSRELASIAVKPDWRRQGVATSIIERLLQAEKGPLYLTCRLRLGSFYERFGFKRLQPQEMPPYFRRLHRLVAVLRVIPAATGDLLVMGRPSPAKPGRANVGV